MSLESHLMQAIAKEKQVVGNVYYHFIQILLVRSGLNAHQFIIRNNLNKRSFYAIINKEYKGVTVGSLTEISAAFGYKYLEDFIEASKFYTRHGFIPEIQTDSYFVRWLKRVIKRFFNAA